MRNALQSASWIFAASIAALILILSPNPDNALALTIFETPTSVEVRTAALAVRMHSGDASIRTTVGGQELGEPGYLEVVDAVTGEADRCVESTVVGIDGTEGEMRCRLQAFGLDMTLKMRRSGGVSGVIRFEGVVSRTGGTGVRPLFLRLHLPLVKSRWEWHRDVHDSDLLTLLNPVLETDLLMSSHVGDRVGYPFAVMTGPGYGFGALIPANEPQWASIRAERLPKRSLQVEFRVSLSADLVEGHDRDKADFSFSLVSVGTDQPFRRLLHKYQRLYADEFEGRSTNTNHGGWLYRCDIETLLNPQHYQFHEQGSTQQDFVFTQEILDAALARGYHSFVYRNLGLRSAVELPYLPSSYEEALQMFNAHDFGTDPARLFGAGTPEIVANTASLEADGLYDLRIRVNDGTSESVSKPTVSIAVNPDPDLPRDQGQLTQGRVELDSSLTYQTRFPAMRGLYLDSISNWAGNRPNFRQEHHPYSAYPILYDPDTGQNYIHGYGSLLEYLDALRQETPDLWLFGNLGKGGSRAFTGFRLDIHGRENPRLDLLHLNFYRAMAGRKPVLFLAFLSLTDGETVVDTPEKMAAYFRLATFYGFIPSIKRDCNEAYQAYADLYDRYIPIAVELSEAGWNPMRFSSVDSSALRMEVFGADSGVTYFTVYNTAPGWISSTLRIDRRDLTLSTLTRITELTRQREYDPTFTIEFGLQPGDVKVFAARLER